MTNQRLPHGMRMPQPRTEALAGVRPHRLP